MRTRLLWVLCVAAAALAALPLARACAFRGGLTPLGSGDDVCDDAWFLPTAIVVDVSGARRRRRSYAVTYGNDSQHASPVFAVKDVYGIGWLRWFLCWSFNLKRCSPLMGSCGTVALFQDRLCTCDTCGLSPFPAWSLTGKRKLRARRVSKVEKHC